MPICILVVDDEPVIQELFDDILTEEGYTVQTTGTGQRALALYQTMQPDLIFIDIMMPGMDGRWFVKKCAKSNLARHANFAKLERPNDRIKEQ